MGKETARERLMKSIQESAVVDVILMHRKVVHFPQGLGGFEAIKDFVLVAKDHEAPLFWLESKEHEDLAFILLDPYLVNPDYKPEFDSEDLEEIGIDEAEDLIVLCIAHIKNKVVKNLTLNLAAPLAINLRTGLGKQVFIKNSSDYSVEERIWPDQKDSA